MRYTRLLMVLAAALFLMGCYGPSHLKTTYLDDASDVQGTFDVVYYGARFSDDPDSLVVLDVAGDSYKIVPLALEQSYKIETGLPAGEAISKAIAFLKQNKYYDGVKFRAIHAFGGKIIGYEMMPEYEMTTYISPNPISVNYFMKDGDTVQFVVQELYRTDDNFRTSGVEERFRK